MVKVNTHHWITIEYAFEDSDKAHKIMNDFINNQEYKIVDIYDNKKIYKKGKIFLEKDFNTYYKK